MVEAWVTVLVAGIVAVSTLGATFIQNWFSNRRFEKEQQRAIVMYHRERRREVGSEPLLKLRDELSIMGSKLDRLASAMKSLRPRNGVDYETAKQEYDAALEDWNTYLRVGTLSKAFFSQCDIDIVKKVEEISRLYFIYGGLQIFGTDESEAEKNMNIVKEGIIRTQLLINQRLEGL
ncbi:hypothetical protein ACFLT0_00855 [Chloroflexota bacterium]